jgi:hypothetical protein
MQKCYKSQEQPRGGGASTKIQGNATATSFTNSGIVHPSWWDERRASQIAFPNSTHLITTGISSLLSKMYVR